MPTETYLKQKTMSYNTFTLPNGLRIIHAPNQSNVAYCGFAVDAGTLKQADDAVLADTTELDFEGSCDLLVRIIKEKADIR